MKNRIEEEYNRREVKPVRLNKYISDAASAPGVKQTG